MNIIENIRHVVVEWLKTFSNKPSFVSSKRIERFAVFTTMLICTVYFLVKAITSCSINATDLMIVVVGWLGYAGFNTIQGRKDHQQTDKTDEPNQ